MKLPKVSAGNVAAQAAPQVRCSRVLPVAAAGPPRACPKTFARGPDGSTGASAGAMPAPLSLGTRALPGVSPGAVGARPDLCLRYPLPEPSSAPGAVHRPFFIVFPQPTSRARLLPQNLLPSHVPHPGSFITAWAPGDLGTLSPKGPRLTSPKKAALRGRDSRA